MQIVQTKNSIMRIIFNPVLEKFYLGDFLIVRDDFHALVAQVVEVESNEMDSSLNYLSARFIFNIETNGEISDYNGYTPGREADVRKVTRKEVLRVINENQKTLPLGRIVNSNTRMEIPWKFFVNLCAVFADKNQGAQLLTAYLADKLCLKKPVVIFDFTGSEQIEGARRISAPKDFKMPLNSKTIEYVYEKGLSRANIEAQALIEEIFRELKKYSDSTPEKFVPFAAFTNVVDLQYKHTPLPELTVLKNRLKNFADDSIFASSAADFKNINRIISNNEITVIDFSELSLNWVKEFCNFVVNEIKTDCFLLLRLSENNCDFQLIKDLYENKHIIPVPIMGYGFKYASNIKVFLNNYIMFKPLVSRPDFPYYVSFLSRLSSREYIVWGEQTKDCAFIVRNEKFSSSQNEDEEINVVEKEVSPPKNEEPRENINSQVLPHNVLPNEEMNSHKELEKEAQNEVTPELPLNDGVQINDTEELSDEALQKNEEEPVQKNEALEAKDAAQAQLSQRIKDDSSAQDDVLLNDDEAKFEEDEPAEAELLQENCTPEGEEVEIAIETTGESVSVEVFEIAASQMLENAVESELQDSQELIQEEQTQSEASTSQLQDEEPIEPSVEQAQPEQESQITPGQNLELSDDETSLEENETLSASAPKLHDADKVSDDEADTLEQKLPKRRGRPKKEVFEQEEISAPKKRGRPKKVKEHIQEVFADDEDLQITEKPTLTLITNENPQEVITPEIEIVEPPQEQEMLTEQALQNEPSVEEILSEDDLEFFEQLNFDEEQMPQEVENPPLDEMQGVQKDDFDISQNEKPQVQEFIFEDVDKKVDDFITSEEIVQESVQEQQDDEFDFDSYADNEAQLPVYPVETPKNTREYKKNDRVRHVKFGVGTIQKVVNYADKTLLSIEFEAVGKRLLDPALAQIEII